MLADLSGKMGREKFESLLRLAIPTSHKEYTVLVERLKQKNPEGIHRAAHDLKGTVSLFECHHFVDFLERVESLDSTLLVQPDFEMQLEQKYQDFLTQLNQLSEK